MIWADRIGFAFAVFIAASALAMTVILFIAIGGEMMRDGRLDGDIALWAGLSELALALPFWLLLRGIDLLFGGPQRRRRGERVEPAMRDFVTLMDAVTATDQERPR